MHLATQLLVDHLVLRRLAAKLKSATASTGAKDNMKHKQLKLAIWLWFCDHTKRINLIAHAINRSEQGPGYRNTTGQDKTEQTVTVKLPWEKKRHLLASL
jgi:hypothetical protein